MLSVSWQALSKLEDIIVNLSEAIRTRKSVRTFDGETLKPEHRKALEDYISTIENPFGIEVEFVMLDAKEHRLSSPVLAGENLYVAAKAARQKNTNVAIGYSFEKLVLYAHTLGIGTVWIGGTMTRELFEKAAKVQDGEIMPCVSPLGYPAARRSVKEIMMRKGIGADTRIAPGKLFFDGLWGQPLQADADMTQILELVRWAPSAANKQPCRIVYKDGAYHFFEKKNRGYASEATGDMQKVDIGIALCHFVTALEEKGRSCVILTEDPGISVPEDAEYIASVKIS